jgi:hypothetical protein
MKRREQQLESLLRKVENSCAELAAYLEKTFGLRAKGEVARYREESKRAGLLGSRLRDASNMDQFGRGADLSTVFIVQEEIRRRTGKRPGAAQLDVLLQLTAHARGVRNFDYDPDSLRKSLDHFRKNPVNQEWLRTLADTPLQDIANRVFAKNPPETNSPKN